MSAASESSALLARYAPCLRYDSLEGYFADSAEEWTANPGNRLKRKDGGVVATVGDGLTLEFLDAGRYANGEPVEEGDYIETAGDDYSRQYTTLRAGHPGFRNVIYGRSLRSNTGLWLQYWFFYFLNDYRLAWGIDVHEGDWEMIQLRLPEGASEPEAAVYAQHTFCEVRPWSDVRRLAAEKSAAGQPVEAGDADRPLVYAGRGSHASFFEPGYHATDFYDVTDGKRAPKEEARLVVVDDDPAWLRWPGQWGGRRTGYAGPSSPSRHPQWSHPEALLDEAQTPERKPAPDAPSVDVRRRGSRLVLDFDFSATPAPPARLVVTVNSEDERDTPPQVHRFALKDVVRGTLETRVSLDPAKHYDVNTAVVDDAGRPSAARVTVVAPSAGFLGLRRRLTSAVGRLVYLVRLALSARR